jgi:hypothetical protein
VVRLDRGAERNDAAGESSAIQYPLRQANVRRVGKIRAVEQIIELGPELQIEALRNRKLLAEREIELGQQGTSQRISARISEGTRAGTEKAAGLTKARSLLSRYPATAGHHGASFHLRLLGPRFLLRNSGTCAAGGLSKHR